MKCKNCGKPIYLYAKSGVVGNVEGDLYIHTTCEFSCYQGKVGGERAEIEENKNSRLAQW